MNKILLCIFFLLFFVSPAIAHSGRTDSSGGHNCNVGACAGTYHYHNGGGYVAPEYVAPKPICYVPAVVITGTVNVTQNGCTHDISISWSKNTDSNQFSISLSKSAGANPGPIADTYTESYVFKNVESGRWYINLKSGNSCGWNRTSYWTVDVPKIVPTINYFTQKRMSGDSVELSYSASCATNATISSIGMVSLKNNSVIVTQKKDNTYKLVVNGKGGASQRELYVPKPIPTLETTPTPKPTLIPSSTPTPTKKGFWKWIFG